MEGRTQTFDAGSRAPPRRPGAVHFGTFGFGGLWVLGFGALGLGFGAKFRASRFMV